MVSGCPLYRGVLGGDEVGAAEVRGANLNVGDVQRRVSTPGHPRRAA